MDYEKIGLKAGIEIHQQLDTEEKLFCHCPTLIRENDERTREYHRYLRATVSELGEIDRAAEEEMIRSRRFTYLAYDSTCLVEDDEEPPAPLNAEALRIALLIARMLGMTPVEQVHVMRKLVIDGSNTSGFQRTALLALNGRIPGGARIETLCLEEEAARRVDDETFSLDRLGIPLVEITTAPDMRTPEEVRDVAAHLGMVLRSTGKVKRGLGTIRQDINISIRDGARVEIKGVQELDLIPVVVRGEVKRQLSLLEIRDILRSRDASVDRELYDVTDVFSDTASEIIRKAPTVIAVILRGFGGLVGREIQPGRRLGSELADYARKCGVGGIFHTDELPAYGVTEEEVSALHRRLGTGEDDCIVLVADGRERAECAARRVCARALKAIEGVPEETRRMLPDGSTAYMRPLPGAARMYPETDVLPVSIDMEAYEKITIPELLTDRAERFAAEFKLDPAVARQIAFSPHVTLFEELVADGVRPTLAARTLLATLRELRREGVDTEIIGEQEIRTVLCAVRDGRVAKEAIPEMFRDIAGGTPPEDVIASRSTVPEDDLRARARDMVNEREEFVRQRGRGALGPLMGVLMKEFRGRVDGKAASRVLGEEIERLLNS
ncbi:MAG: Glu-tRNA(Gln) amidotransferase subunit GatE [Methanoculleaceae archaeon]